MPEKTDEQLAAEAERLDAQLDVLKPKLLGYPNVVDVYVGIKTIQGYGSDVVCFVAEVAEKKPLSELGSDERIPAEIDGHPVDVYDREKIVIPLSEVYCGGVSLRSGTLGVFALATATNTHLETDTPVMVTNHHVASRIGEPVGVGSICDCICSHCCEDGIIVDSRRDASMDVAIAKLSSDTRYSHEILEIGPVRGSTAPTRGMSVSKYGNKTGLTRGRIQSLTASPSPGGTPMNNQVRVVPLPPTTHVALGGDSGSVLVQDSTNRVVGIIHAKPKNGTSAFACPIGPVLTAMHIQIPVTGSADTIPLGSATAAVRSVTGLRESVAELEAKLCETALGRHWLALARSHLDEVRSLVNRDRHAKVVWQRVQGPAFVAHWVKSAREPDYVVPVEIAGMRIENALLALCATFRERGSPRLARDATEHYLTVLELTRGCRRADEFVERVLSYTRQHQRLEVGHGR